MKWIFIACVVAASASAASAASQFGQEAREDWKSPTERLLQLAQSYSCSPRKTCSRTVGSCDEAYWLMRNCSWGGRLDRDNDGIPCENLC